MERPNRIGGEDRESGCASDSCLELRDSDRRTLLGSAMASLGHELGTPLNIIVGRATMIAEQRMPSEEVREHARMMAEQARRIAQAFQRWRFHSDHPPPLCEPIDLAALADRALQLLRPVAESTGTVLLLSGADGPQAQGDPEGVLHALVELVQNAVEATPGGVVTVSFGELEVAERPDHFAAPGRYAWVAVHDNGPGVPDGDRSRIFEPFFTTKAGKLGLGLTLARHVLRKQGGWLTHVPGRGERGTTMMLHVPT